MFVYPDSSIRVCYANLSLSTSCLLVESLKSMSMTGKNIQIIGVTQNQMRLYCGSGRYDHFSTKASLSAKFQRLILSKLSSACDHGMVKRSPGYYNLPRVPPVFQ